MGGGRPRIGTPLPQTLSIPHDWLTGRPRRNSRRTPSSKKPSTAHDTLTEGVHGVAVGDRRQFERWKAAMQRTRASWSLQLHIAAEEHVPGRERTLLPPRHISSPPRIRADVAEKPSHQRQRTRQRENDARLPAGSRVAPKTRTPSQKVKRVRDHKSCAGKRYARTHDEYAQHTYTTPKKSLTEKSNNTAENPEANEKSRRSKGRTGKRRTHKEQHQCCRHEWS